MTFRRLVVTALGTDPAQVIVSDGTDEGAWSASALASYSPRAAGDEVLAVSLGGRSWLVLGAIGPTRPPIIYGVGAPTDGGWRQSTTAWIRDQPDGSTMIYLDTAGSVPLPAKVSAIGAVGWLANTTATYELPRAGAASVTQGDWSGGWMYGTGISAACVGKTVSKMAVRVARNGNGRNAPTLLRMGLHNSVGPATPLTNTWVTTITLSPNGAALVDIPAVQRGLLAAGSVTGIGVWGQGTAEYAEFTTSADVTITFG